jgi:uroporphyrinogen-III synthase
MPNKPVLVVRPLREEDAFLKLLDQAGISFNYTPIMSIDPVSPETVDFAHAIRCIDELEQFNQVIFISANAAEIGLPMIAQRWSQIPKNTQFLAVGQQTADIFSVFDYPVSYPQRQPNTEGLLQELPQLQDLTAQSVLVLRGGRGRQTLGDELARRGALVTYAELYQRNIDAKHLVEAQNFASQASCIVVHSGELLQAMGSPADKRIPLVVPSDRIAQLAQEMGYQSVKVAQNALPSSMYEAVVQSL